MSHKDTYIPPLDGLRAVAIALVLLFHVDVSFLGGGFIGVDVFFVISGFIITKGLMRDLETGEFSFARFVKRRFARLIPALVVTVAATSVAGYFLMTPMQLTDFAQSGIAALLSVSNVFFFFTSGYFDGDAATKPLLHTWSLAVEEQFYLAWPLLTAAAFWLGKRRAVLATVGALTAASFLAAVLLEPRNHGAVFYLTPFRVYQFGLGALIGAGALSLKGWLAGAAASVGLLALAVVATFAPSAPVYMFVTVLPAAAAASFLLGLNSRPAKLMLGNAIATAVGRRAYSIYLVHWPLIVLSQGHSVALGVAAPVVLIAASLVLGEVLHRFVERPFRSRDGQTGRQENVLWGTSMAQASVLAMCTVFWGTSGLSWRYQSTIVQITDAAQNERAQVGAIADFGRCSLSDNMPASDFDPDYCLSKASDRVSVAILGDSYGIETVVGLRDLLGSVVHFAHASYAGCAPLPTDAHEKSGLQCQEFNNQRLRTVYENGFETVVLTGNWQPAHLAPLSQLVSDMTDKGIDVFVIGVRASFDGSVPDLLFAAGSTGDANETLRSHLLPNRSEIDALAKEQITAAGGRYIEVLGEQCAHLCPAVGDAGELLYFDSSHLTRAGAAELARVIDEQTDGFS